MAQLFSRWAIVEICVEVEVLTREDGYTRVFCIVVNSLMVNNGRLFQVIERELLWLLQAQDIVIHPGVPPEL